MNNLDAVRYDNLRPPKHKRWLPPKKMTEAFPEMFLTLQKCPDSNGQFYLMNHSDWNYVLSLLDQKEWGVNYDKHVLEYEERIHRKDIKNNDKELAEASFCKGVNPQDVDQAEIFGADRLDNMDLMDQDIRKSKMLA